jgi:hypothetical protein
MWMPHITRALTRSFSPNIKMGERGKVRHAFVEFIHNVRNGIPRSQKPGLQKGLNGKNGVQVDWPHLEEFI